MHLKLAALTQSINSCRALMDVTTRIVRDRTSDELMGEFPCFVEMQGSHNHLLGSAGGLNEPRLPFTTREVCERYLD